jgi:threonine/homoserine/homoserine lactone efflux protein
MVPELSQFIGLALACALLIAVPGPSVVFVVGRALTYGRRTALTSVAGNSVGCYAAAALVAVGLGPLLQRSEGLLTAIKWAGAAYLVWLGVQALRHAAPLPDAPGGAGDRVPTWRSLRSGIVVGISNPKVFLVFAAVLPQFVDPGAGHVPAQMLLLALVPVAVGLLTDSAWALAASRARGWLSRSPRRTTAVGRAGGLSMIGLGVSVALTGHRR